MLEVVSRQIVGFFQLISQTWDRHGVQLYGVDRRKVAILENSRLVIWSWFSENEERGWAR